MVGTINGQVSQYLARKIITSTKWYVNRPDGDYMHAKCAVELAQVQGGGRILKMRGGHISNSLGHWQHHVGIAT